MLDQFVNKNQFDINNTQEWIDFIYKFTKDFGLQSFVFESDNGMCIYINSQEEHQLLEDLLYLVENTEVTLNYIFEGNMEYGSDYYEN